MEVPLMSASLRRALEDELAASPDDLATHAAYADLLGELDDPRAEVIQTPMALEDDSLDRAQRDALTQRDQQLWRDHSQRIRGGLPPFLHERGVSFKIRRG